jgi:transportin-3
LLSLLRQTQVAADAKGWAASQLKQKILFDLRQLPPSSLPGLRDAVVDLMLAYRTGPRPIRTQLSVALADLAIQMTEWKDVLPLVGSKFGASADSIPCLLSFLRVLPEEINGGRKIPLPVCSINFSQRLQQSQTAL